MAIGTSTHDVQLQLLRTAVSLWSPQAYDDGIAPVVTIKTMGERVALRGRVLDVAVPYPLADRELPPGPVLVVHPEGGPTPVYLQGDAIISISFGGRTVR